MIVLGIETSADSSSISLVDENGLLAEMVVGYSRRHIETVTPGIEALLRVVNIDISSIDGIAVDVGPGLFTGLRVGVATAKSLCYALGIKAVALGSLEVLAEGVLRAVHPGYLEAQRIGSLDQGVAHSGERGKEEERQAGVPARQRTMTGSRHKVMATDCDAKSEGRQARDVYSPSPLHDWPLHDWIVVPVVDVKRGQLFWNTYVVDGTSGIVHLVAAGDPRLSSPRELVDSLIAATQSDGAQTKIFIAGSGVLDYSEEFIPLQAYGVTLGAPMLATPSAGVVASLGLKRFMMGQYEDYDKLIPQYAREPDAVVNWKRRDTGRPDIQPDIQPDTQMTTQVVS
ncbi:MAG: tRNA (adenosine(37)-N6)-threonylcarbamoyltransferase complex dimerization subunit type 1 TsaB [Actinobacteria bacterium]|nr:tRNA (adenosine(37)-N6)-threonylcarbamoyltransferase complex dimerization subunit type 1 TsaB [Actinomycetota bacterium]